jgi:AcrR family transcriptional regulator
LVSLIRRKSAPKPGKNQRPTSRLVAKQQTRVKIMAAAKLVFESQGYDAATVRDIAGLAGVSTGAIVDHFESKPLLYAAFLEFEVGQFVEHMFSKERDHPEIFEALQMIGAKVYSSTCNRPAVIRDIMSMTWSLDGPSLGDLVRTFRPVIDLVKDVFVAAQSQGQIRRDLDLEQLTHLCWLALAQVYSQVLRNEAPPAEIPEVFGQSLSLILEGARPRA